MRVAPPATLSANRGALLEVTARKVAHRATRCRVLVRSPITDLRASMMVW